MYLPRPAARCRRRVMFRPFEENRDMTTTEPTATKRCKCRTPIFTVVANVRTARRASGSAWHLPTRGGATRQSRIRQEIG